MPLSNIKSEQGKQEQGATHTGEEFFKAVAIVDEDGAAHGFKMAGGKPRVTSTDYLTDIGLGNVPDHVSRRAYGRNPTVGILLEADITEAITGTAHKIHYPAAAVALEIISTSTDDALGGTGIETVEVHYLDADWNEHGVHLDMAGTAPVAFPATAIRFLAVHTVKVGTVDGGAVGVISVRETATPTNVYGIVGIGNTNSKIAGFSVPAGKVGVITGWSWGAGKGKEVEVRLKANIDPYSGETSDGAYNEHDSAPALVSSDARKFSMPIKIVEKSDVKLTAIGTDAGTTGVSGSIEYFIEPA